MCFLPWIEFGLFAAQAPFGLCDLHAFAGTQPNQVGLDYVDTGLLSSILRKPTALFYLDYCLGRADADVGEARRERSRVRCDDDFMDQDLGSWEPLSPREVSAVLGGMPCPWWVAGGWAIDLHLGRETRAHADIDVLVLRDDQLEVQRHLIGWDLQAADPPGTLRPWSKGEVLPTSVRDVWCRRLPSSPWCLQLMFGDTADGEWVYHRDPRIRRPVAKLDGPSSNAGLRVLAPDIQLLYKSTDPREKDEADFRAMRGRLDPLERGWLRDALSVASPVHPWLSVL